jgi:hypothetical protein
MRDRLLIWWKSLLMKVLSICCICLLLLCNLIKICQAFCFSRSSVLVPRHYCTRFLARNQLGMTELGKRAFSLAEGQEKQSITFVTGNKKK